MPPIDTVYWRKAFNAASERRQSKPSFQYATSSLRHERLVPVDHGASGGSSGKRVRARRSRSSSSALSGIFSWKGRGEIGVVRP
jgi:hypothetical protein